MTMWRGSLASLIFTKTLRLDPSIVKDSAPITHMSTDVEGIALGATDLHNVWGGLIELPVAMYLLYRHVGLPSLLILIPTFSKLTQRRDLIELELRMPRNS